MAYSGWLLKVGDYIVPTDKFIKADSYKAYVNMQSLEPWTDANGYLHFEGVDLKALKVEFETPELLTNTEFEELMSSIRRNFTSEKSRKCIVTAYIPEYDKYISQLAYMADINPQIYGNYENKLRYRPIRFAFIGGVYEGGD